MTRPLVSIMLPCFNGEDTLPLALASAFAQTESDWECICLDDGSTDGTWDVMHAAAARDPRFRLERFATNKGRGAARQRVLEVARGHYLAFQDADDWMYPARLSREAAWLEADGKIAAVSACAAVTEGADKVVGLLQPRADVPLPVVARFERPVPPPFVFPSSMIRTDLARATGFDSELRRSQDSDFLIRALLGKHYALGSEVLYAYSQATAASLSRTLEGYRYRMRSHLRHWKAHPLRVARTLAETGAKLVTYRAAGVLGLEDRLISRRWQAAPPEVATELAGHLTTIRATCDRLFEGTRWCAAS